MAIGLLAVRIGLSPFLGLSVAVTPALLESSVGGLADALAFALAVWGVVLWRQHIWIAVALFTVAALARETSLVVPLACLLVGPRQTRLPLLVPPALWAVWAATVAFWLPSGEGSDDLSRFGWPFHGWAEVGWQSESVALGVMLVSVSMLSAFELRAELPELAAWLVLDAGILVMVGPSVVGRPLNFARVAVVAVPAGALALASYRRRKRAARTGLVEERA